MSTLQKVPVTERALLQRINRKLQPEYEQVRRARGYTAAGWKYDHSTLGRFYRIDLTRNQILDMKIDLEAYGRELGALADWEALKEEE